MFLERVHEYLTNNSILNNNGNRHKICQMLREDKYFERYVDEDGWLFIK